MGYKDLKSLENEWIRDDENVHVQWIIKETEEKNVEVSGILIITVDNITFDVKRSCNTSKDDESIGRAMQAINSDILSLLKKIG